MTDITELAQSLKAAAEKAGADCWQVKKIGGDFYVIRKGSYKRECGYTTYQPIAEIYHKPTRDYVALANPANLLALVESLEKAQQQITQLESRTVTVKPEDADGVREEGNQFLVVRHPGKVPVIKHPVGHLEDYLLQILKADPLATIDIVTHRYYGAGGQFVEDADEYLHEMSIKVEAE
ncbi:ead/Ea22-like family protein [Klebsiella pneumoniae]|nr:ead/Ea22-like family protein [Klebsiella pneumoniae]